MLHEVAFLDCDIFHMRICRANTIWMIDAHIERSADLTCKADMACPSRHHWRIWLSFIFPAPIAWSTDVRWRTKPINYHPRNWLHITSALSALIDPALIVSTSPDAIAQIACKIAGI